MSAENGHIDFHDLTNRIHGNYAESARHWDELIVKYLQCELVEPLQKSLNSLNESINILSHNIENKFAINNDKLLRLNEAADLLQVHKVTLMKLARTGKIRARKVGVSWRFLHSDIMEYQKR